MSAISIRREVARRAEIAAGLFSWSEERMAGLLDELARQERIPGRSIQWMDPADFELTEDDVFFPGPEDEMPSGLRYNLGRYDAAQAFMTWDAAPEEHLDRASVMGLALTFVDRTEWEHADQEAVAWLPEFRIENMAALYLDDGGASHWLQEEHEASISDGSYGYTDLLLGRIHTPCVYIQHGDDPAEIADGWHRTAAALVTGSTALPAVLVPLAEREPDADIPLDQF